MTAARTRAPATGGSTLPYLELWDRFEQLVIAHTRASKAHQVAELGGGANPSEAISGALVPEGVGYTVVDVSATELAKAPLGLQTAVADLSRPVEPEMGDRFDLVFSRMLCEHLVDAETFHRNCHAMLRPGGLAIHFFPTVTTLPFLANKLIPEATAARLLDRIDPRRHAEGRHGKFPAYYRWCRGPTGAQVRRLEGVGFEVVEHHVGYGHGYYHALRLLEWLEERKTRVLLAHPTPHLASYCCVVLRKAPAGSDGEPGRGAAD